MTNSDPGPLLESLTRYDYTTLRVLQHLCRRRYWRFVRVFFKERTSTRFLVNWHHLVICDVLQRVVSGEISRLIINCPPGYSKTELTVRLFFAYMLAVQPRAKSLHLSYSGDLAWQNSLDVREIVSSSLFQALFPGPLRPSSKAKKSWRTENGGGLVSAPTGGQVTGFRAGRLEDGFFGAIVIDDPIKPEDAIFPRIRKRINQRFVSTIQSRLARPETPIVIIMQRVHEDDLTGYLLKGGNKERWRHLVIPAEINAPRPDYPKEYRYGSPIQYPSPIGYTWPLKTPESYAEALKGQIMTWATQYQQMPTVETGEIFKHTWWQHYDHYDPIRNCIIVDGDEIGVSYKCIYADTAMKTGEANDWSVLQCWAYLVDNRIALIDQSRGKWEAPDLRDHFLEFCTKHQYDHGVNNMGVRAIKVEDKASGTGLIQEINRLKGHEFVTGIPRDKDKVSRAKSGAPQIKLGRVLLPRGAPWLDEYVSEFHRFNSAMTHAHDDQIDPTLDAIQDMIINDTRIRYDEVIG